MRSAAARARHAEWRRKHCGNNDRPFAALHHKPHESRMTLFCLLCVSLVLGGWAMRHTVHTAFEALRLQLFDIPILIICRPEPSRIDRVRITVSAALPCPLPPPRAAIRAGP
jgi:hypothetical protein